jgi:hypothetical protein
MTLASDLGHSVCPLAEAVPGVVHDPALPLILGDQAAGLFTAINYDPAAKKTTIQVTAPAGTSIFTFSYDGHIAINGVPLDQSEAIAAQVAAAEAAAQNALIYSNSAATSADAAETASNSASDAANDAFNNATLSGQYASAPPETVLPGGGKSSAASAQDAQTVAATSRQLQLSDPVTASETVASGFLYTERQVVPVASEQIVITVPPSLYSSSSKRAGWASYKLAKETGSIRVVAAGGGTDKQVPTRKGASFAHYRMNNPGTTKRHTLVVPTVIPAITLGEIVFIFYGSHQGPAVEPTINLTNNGGLTPAVIRALPAFASAVAYPDFAVYRAPLSAYAGGGVDFSFDEGPYVHYQHCDWWALEGTTGVAPIVAVSAQNGNNRATCSVTLPGLVASSLVLASAAQIAPASAGSAFSNWSASIQPQQSGNTNGIPDVLVSDNSIYANALWASGYGVTTAAGDLGINANWTVAGGKTAMCALAYPPKDVIGAGAVSLKLEGGRDTLTVPWGVMELWFQPDGTTVHVRTPKP